MQTYSLLAYTRTPIPDQPTAIHLPTHLLFYSQDVVVKKRGQPDPAPAPAPTPAPAPAPAPPQLPPQQPSEPSATSISMTTSDDAPKTLADKLLASEVSLLVTPFVVGVVVGVCLPPHTSLDAGQSCEASRQRGVAPGDGGKEEG